MTSTETYNYILNDTDFMYGSYPFLESSPESCANDILDSSSNSPIYEELIQMPAMDILPSTSFANNPESSGPYLTIEKEFKTKLRFRYKSEKGQHGGLKPIIKLHNYNGDHSEVFIKASLYTVDKFPRPHVLELSGKQCKDGICWQKLSPDCTATFPSLSIYTKKKEEILAILKDRKKFELKKSRKKLDEAAIDKEAKEELKTLNLACVRFCFEAFRKKEIPVGNKIFSNPISNQKNPVTGDLKITRLSSYSGKCSGGDDIILLCDKVRKDDIAIHIYEKNDEDLVVWEAEGQFNTADVHHQVAIPFKMPPYKENKETSVWIALFRKSDEKLGEARQFRYIPDDNPDDAPLGKRKRSNLIEPSSTCAMKEMSNINEPSCSSTMSNIAALDVSQQSEMPSNVVDANLIVDWQFDPLSEILSFDPTTLHELLNPPEFHNQPVFDNKDKINIDATTDDFVSLNISKESKIGVSNGKKDVLKFSNEEEVKKLKEFIIHILRSRDKNSFTRLLPILMGIKDEEKNNLLHLTIKERSSDLIMLIKLLQAAPFDLKNEANKFHKTPLHLAVNKGLWKIVRILLRLGANPNIKDRDGNNCVHLAVKYNFPQCLGEILFLSVSEKCVPSINDLNHEGLAPLHLAIMSESKICTELLIKAKANINVADGKSGKTPLHFAYEQDSKLVQYLLSQPSIDKSAMDFSGNAPLTEETSSCDGEISLKSTKCFLKAELLENTMDLEENIVKTNEITSCENDKAMECCIDISSENTSDENISTSVSDSEIFQVKDIDSEIEEKLCEILDSNGQFREFGKYIMDKEEVDTIAELDSTPTQTILNQLKKRHGNKYSEELLYILRGNEFKNVMKMLKV